MWVYVFFPCRQISRNGIAESYGKYMFTLEKKKSESKTVIKSGLYHFAVPPATFCCYCSVAKLCPTLQPCGL